MKRLIFSLVVAAAIAISAVVVTSCGNIQAQGGGSGKSERWEYFILTHSETTQKEELNKLGSEGWELVSVANYGGPVQGVGYAYFKRRLP